VVFFYFKKPLNSPLTYYPEKAAARLPEGATGSLPVEASWVHFVSG